jgi:hypothetical protein
MLIDIVCPSLTGVAADDAQHDRCGLAGTYSLSDPPRQTDPLPPAAGQLACQDEPKHTNGAGIDPLPLQASASAWAESTPLDSAR